MHLFKLPAIPVSAALHAEIEALLAPNETLPAFVQTAIEESLARRRQQQVTDHARAALAVAALPLSVLVVDDDDFSHALLREVLASLGVHAVHSALDGRRGAEVLDQMQRAPDFVICDMLMPETDGIDFLGHLARRQYQGGVILLSGEDSLMLSIAAEVAESDGLKVLGSFSKPLRRHDLADLMGLVHEA